MSVTIYSTSHCPQCAATKRQFSKLGIDYRDINLEEQPQVLEQLRAEGFHQAPVVVTDDQSWCGYRPDLIKQLAATLNSQHDLAARVAAAANANVTVLA
ncbi:glutaredoxin-like protein NrdH [Bifidobacterium oedipodis]|uniref:Glutaredoxin-like protein NrdH n=1 Tax=Bifidobacterium oedipodis TaxID=2675322 RepID=A0A7Y0HQW1_9BIFI|nr:glutaredoxin-like protein NrdH [Bifidobacterium sp. DSM 109957]NMM93345.1 NrdH-redoxin [Bifidobacterium sp. DSM 109957]